MWIGHIVELLCTTVDTRSHELVLCPFFSRRGKAQVLCTQDIQSGRWWAYQSAKNGENWRSKHLQRWCMRNAAAAAGISHSTCHRILSDDLNVSRVTQHNVPRVLMQDQRDDRLSSCSDLIDRSDKDGVFLNRVIAGDNTLCFLYDPQLKQQ
jgi:hypothetical protein